ncbi:MAG: nucleotide sugar dehydrogenase [Endomicrobiaceae bacterium]|nr:nucleotide sugar dehydrogenase [Endomicrobiaceae bacterium]MDD3922507.1 nucleotide sugar dehydrogenase [Endomicrobiaceae bacterium]
MIAVIGLGYVGLTTALGFSEKGFKVYGIDNNKEKLNSIIANKIPFFEKGLPEILNKKLNKKFFVKNSLSECVDDIEVIFVCVETPVDDTGKANLTYLQAALKSVLSVIKPKDKKLIVIKSTVPPSTTTKKIIPFIKRLGFKAGYDVHIAYNPEFLREGTALEDFIKPDRIIAGVNDEYSKQVLNKIFKPFKAPVYFVSLNTSEFVKYLSNSFLATLLSYSNEMSMIADSIGNIDIKSAFKLFHEDKRWFGKPAFMQGYAYPCCGFGGSCLPKDIKSLINKSSEFGYNAKILKDVIDINEEIKVFWINKITKNLRKDTKIAVLGLSFKPDTEDVRDTPSSAIIKMLIKKGYKNITAYDPLSNKLFDKVYNVPVKYASSMKGAVSKSDVIILATAWQEFLDNKDLLSKKIVFDLRYKL